MPFTVSYHNTLLGTLPATVYFSLHTANPTDAGTAEATGGSYARQGGALTAASGGQRTNAEAESFVNMPAGTFTHFGVWSAATSGTLIAYGPLTTSRTTVLGDRLDAAIGDFVIKLNQA